MILEAQQKWARLFAGNRTYSHVCPAELERIEMHPPGITQGLPPGDDLPREFGTVHGEVGGPGHFDAYACFDFDFNRVTDFPLAKPFDSMHHQVRFADVHPNVLIPEKLVTGPWDEEMVRRLVWLRRGGAILQESQTWEVSTYQASRGHACSLTRTSSSLSGSGTPLRPTHPRLFYH